MRAILVDPKTKTITEVEHSDDYRDIYRLIEATDFNVVNINDPGNHSIFVDGESLLVDEPGPFFKWVDYHQPIAGKGLILAIDKTGKSVAATLSLEDVQAKVSWPDIEFVGFESIPEGATINHPVFGKISVIGHTPRFREKK